MPRPAPVPKETKPDLSAAALAKETKVEGDKWSKIPSQEEIDAAIRAMQARGFKVVYCEKRKEVAEEIKKLIPWGSEVMSGSSTTLNELGFTDWLENGNLGWKNVKKQINEEKNSAVRDELRRKSVTSEYFVSSVNAIAQTGELVAADASGSRAGAFHFAAKNLIIVAGANKIVPTLEDALKRLREYAFPLEDVRAKKVYGMGSGVNKIVILAREMQPGRVTVVLVKDKLGY